MKRRLTKKQLPVKAATTAAESMVEICRSVSFKLNLGNYQSMDFFCSQKATCFDSMRNEVSLDLEEWCQDQIRESVRKVKEGIAAKAANWKENM